MVQYTTSYNAERTRWISCGHEPGPNPMDRSANIGSIDSAELAIDILPRPLVIAMSFVDTSKLRGLQDPTIAFFTTTIAFTTAVLTIDALTQYGAYIKSFRIVNNDGTNVINFVQGDASQPTKQVPINSDFIADGWESYVKITPNAVTGSGYIELDLVTRPNAEVR